MITGLVGGMNTLVWALVLLVGIIYVVALCFREIFGRKEGRVLNMFDSVPRSMFTVFRCAFGDCSNPDGTPVFEWVTQQYGGVYSILYCMFLFLITVGLFNVISAIFVGSTMESFEKQMLVKQQDRLADKELWSSRVTTLVICFLEYIGHDVKDRTQAAQELEGLLTYEVGHEVFREWVQDPRVMEALHDLDINPDDHFHLFHILDCDQSGGLYVSEIIDGIMRLRGEPRRSDVITIDLMVRAIQSQCNAIEQGVQALQNRPVHVEGY
jgi:hypothetical protein